MFIKFLPQSGRKDIVAQVRHPHRHRQDGRGPQQGRRSHCPAERPNRAGSSRTCRLPHRPCRCLPDRLPPRRPPPAALLPTTPAASPHPPPQQAASPPPPFLRFPPAVARSRSYFIDAAMRRGAITRRSTSRAALPGPAPPLRPGLSRRPAAAFAARARRLSAPSWARPPDASKSSPATDRPPSSSEPIAPAPSGRSPSSPVQAALSLARRQSDRIVVAAAFPSGTGTALATSPQVLKLAAAHAPHRRRAGLNHCAQAPAAALARPPRRRLRPDDAWLWGITHAIWLCDIRNEIKLQPPSPSSPPMPYALALSAPPTAPLRTLPPVGHHTPLPGLSLARHVSPLCALSHARYLTSWWRCRSPLELLDAR